MRRIALLASLAFLSSLLWAAPAANAAVEHHCVIQVVGKAKSGELKTTPPVCYPTFSQAMAATGVPGATSLQQGASSARIGGAQPMGALSLIGIHYDGFGWSGDSMSVTGSDCSGGWLNTSSSWNNRISSTANGCYNIAHYDNANLGGGYEVMTGSGGNLSTMNNRTESIQYF